jgi:hypothetical protein
MCECFPRVLYDLAGLLGRFGGQVLGAAGMVWVSGRVWGPRKELGKVSRSGGKFWCFWKGLGTVFGFLEGSEEGFGA